HVLADADAIAMANAVAGYLSLVLGRQADYNTNLCTWHNTGEKLNHTFGRQALPMSWDYVELNVMSGSGGDWGSQLDWVVRYINNNGWTAPSRVFTMRASAASHPLPDGSLDAIISDPPYYDNVPYAALSDFFYVWLKRASGEYFPELFSTPIVPKSEEAIMEPV